MGGVTEVSGGRVFISYRRDDAGYPAGWLFDRLVARFGAGRVFKDVDSIEPGDDFAEVIRAAVGSCAALVAVIGSRWLTVADESGRRRLDNPADFVRLEIETALARQVRVIPVLVDGAMMPRAEQLPASMSALSGKQAVGVSHARFESDTRRLLNVLERTLNLAGGQSASARARAQAGPVPAGMTLHEALAEILRDSSNEPMTARQLADAVNARGTYRRRDGLPVPPSEVSARTNEYNQMFVKENGLIRLLNQASPSAPGLSVAAFRTMMRGSPPGVANTPMGTSSTPSVGPTQALWSSTGQAALASPVRKRSTGPRTTSRSAR